MSEQLDWTEAYARRTDPETSHEAAASIEPSRLEGEVYEALRRFREGATTRELSKSMNLDWGSVTPRIAPLRRKGLVKDSGLRRLGNTGRKLIVWVVVNPSVGFQ